MHPGNPAAVAHDLECIALILAALQQDGVATRLLGAAEALRENASTPMIPFERMEYDPLLTSLRARMDESAFSNAWAAGRRLTMDEAVADALELPGTSPSEGNETYSTEDREL